MSSELDSYRELHIREHEQLLERLDRVENDVRTLQGEHSDTKTTVTVTKGSFDDLKIRLDEIARDVKDLDGQVRPKKKTFQEQLAQWIPILLAVGAVIFTAAKVPSREEMDRIQTKMEQVGREQATIGERVKYIQETLRERRERRQDR